jgi:hypothetical protein
VPQTAVMGASLACTFGLAPSALVVLPAKRVLVEKRPAATIADVAPMVNIPPFGMCTSPSNPTVAAATAAALGVLTPMPCIPAPVGLWAPGAPMSLVGGTPALTVGCTLTCAYAGVITVTAPGSAMTQTK